MLVLSRKSTESIQIGDAIEIRVLQVAGGRVKLGISAPAEVPVHRSEVAERISGFLDEPPTVQPAAAMTAIAGGDVPLRRRAR